MAWFDICLRRYTVHSIARSSGVSRLLACCTRCPFPSNAASPGQVECLVCVTRTTRLSLCDVPRSDPAEYHDYNFQ